MHCEGMLLEKHQLHHGMQVLVNFNSLCTIALCPLAIGTFAHAPCCHVQNSMMQVVRVLFYIVFFKASADAVLCKFSDELITASLK